MIPGPTGIMVFRQCGGTMFISQFGNAAHVIAGVDVPANALLNEDGTPILNEDGSYILVE